MNTKVRYETHCDVIQESTNKAVRAEVMAFNEGRNLTVVMNKSVKLLMNWNGRVYEGRIAGMDFISHGPKGTTYSQGR